MALQRRIRTIVVITALAASSAFGALAFAAGASGGGGDLGGMSGPSINPQQSYNEGLQALQARDYRTAVRRLRDVVEVAPNDALANYFLGVAHIGNGDQRAARRPLQRAVRDPAAPADAWLQLGLVHLALNDREQAVAQQTALDEKIAACDAACGDTRRTELQSARDALTRALEAPAAAPAPTTGWLPPGVGEGRAAYARGVSLANQGQYAVAFMAFSDARAAIGPNADVLNYMGFTSRRLGRTEDALAYYRQALTLAPDHRGATEYLGELYLQTGRRAEAERMLARLDRLCPYSCIERDELQRRLLLASN